MSYSSHPTNTGLHFYLTDLSNVPRAKTLSEQSSCHASNLGSCCDSCVGLLPGEGGSGSCRALSDLERGLSLQLWKHALYLLPT